MESGRVLLAFLFFIIFPLFWAIYRHDIFFQEDLWEVSVKIFMKCLNILPAPLRFIQEPVPQNPRGVFSSLWNEFSTIVQTSFLKKPVPQKPQGVFISLWRRISEVLPIFLKSLKDVTSFSKEQLTSSFQILCENNVLNLFLVICIILAVFTWILKMKIFIETLLAFKEFREGRSCWNQTYNHHALMNLRQRVQPCRRKQQIVKPCRCSCRRGERHKQQNDNGTWNYMANTPSLGLSQLCNNLNESYCHQSAKRLNKRVSLISPHKSVKHSYQGNARAMTKGGKGNENYQSQVQDLLKNAYSEFNRQVAMVNTVSPIMDYHVTNNLSGTRMKKSVSPGSANTSEVGAVQASHKGLVKGKDLQKQHKSATTIQVNNRGHKTRKNLQKTQSGKNTLTTQYIDGDLCSEVGIPVFHLQEESRYTSKAKEDSDLSRARSLNDQGESCGMMLKTSPVTSARYYDVVFHFGLERNGVKSNFLVDPAKKEAVVTIQAGYRGYLVRNDLKRKQQSATTIQTNYRGYRVRKHMKSSQKVNNIVNFQAKPAAKEVNSSRSSPRSDQGQFSRLSSRSPGLSPKYDQDSSLEHQRRVQMGKVIRPRLGHDGGTTSCDARLKSVKKPSPHCDVPVSSHGYERIRMKSHVQVDAAKEKAVVVIQAGYRGYLVRYDLKKKHQSATTIQTNYRGYRTRNHLKKTHNEDIVTTPSGSRSYQGPSSKPSSRSPRSSPKYDQDLALEHQDRVQMGKVIRPRLGHDGGTASCDVSLKSMKNRTPRCDVVVSSHGHEKRGVKNNFLVHPSKEEAVVIIQAGYRGYLVRNDLKKKHQSATTIQTNYRGHRTRNHLKKTHNENKIVTFREEPAEYKVTNTMTSSQSSSRSHQGHSSRPSSRSPGLSPKYDRDFALEHQRRVQMGKVIRR